MGLNIYHSNKLNLQLKKLQATYIEIKNSNKEIKEKLQRTINHQRKWLKFTKNEFPYASNISILNSLHKAFIGKKVKLKDCSIMGSDFKLTIETKDDFIIYLNLLNKIKFLEDVTIKNVNRKRDTALYEAHIIPMQLEEK